MYCKQGLSHQGVEQPVMTIAEWIRASYRRLQGISDTAHLDVQVLLAWTLNRPRAWLMAHADEVLTVGQLELLEQSVRRLEAGEPLPYLLGRPSNSTRSCGVLMTLFAPRSSELRR